MLDDFESGDLSQWGSSATDNGDLSASPASDYLGSYGLQAVLNDSHDLYVEDDTPQGETEYRARFYVDPSGVTMGASDVLDLFDGYNDTTAVLKVQLQEPTAGAYKIRAGLLDNGATWHYTGWYALTNPEPGEGWNAVELSYQALADDGAITLWLNGVSQQSLGQMDNDTRTLTAVRLGAQNIAAATRGTLYFDEFESRRFSYIGQLPEPDLPLGEPVTEPGWAARTYTYDAEHPHAVSAVTPDAGTPDTYVYDANGNMTCRMESGEWFIQSYNAENRLSVVQKVASGDCANPLSFAAQWNFSYDGDGTRVAQAYTPYDENGNPGTPVFTEYFMGGAYEVTDGAIRKYYAIAGMTVALDDGSGLQYLLTDHLGSIVAVTDASGTLTSQQRYLPFGEVRSDVGSIAETDLAYTGQRAVDGLGLLDYHARFYDQAIGRFISPDSIIPAGGPQNLNRYSYVNNSPITYNDPSGHMIPAEPGGGSSSGGCGNPGQISCLGNTGGSGGDNGGEEDDEDLPLHHTYHRHTIDPSNILNTVWDRYKLGWTNYGNAWSVRKNPNAPAIAKAYSLIYILGWGGAHFALAVGLIAIGVDTSSDQQPVGYAPSEEGNRGPFKSPFGSPDLSQSPGDDWEWRTQNPDANPPGSNRGAWQSGDQQLHYDPYEKTHGPHVDYTDPDGNEWRIWPDGSMSPKYPK